LVFHFARSKTPDEAILSFNPKGEKAAAWLKGIKEYRQGSNEYLEQVRKQLIAHVARKYAA
ncbi:MAG: hypothetical protein ACP5IG_03010, partial [Candidatus Micrarchaeia archaeon]